MSIINGQPGTSALRWIRAHALLLILALSVVTRLLAVVYLGNDLSETRGGTYDQISYDALAQRVVAGHGFSFAVDSWPYAKAGAPTAFWSFGYVLFLAAVYAVFGHLPLIARLLQAITVGILLPWLTYRITDRIFGRHAALIAALISAVYLYFILFAAALMTESLYIVVILWSIDAAMRLGDYDGRQVAPGVPSALSRVLLGVELGLALGITLLLRQVILPYFVLLLAWLGFLALHSAHRRSAFLAILVAVLIAVGLTLPAVIRNYFVFGQVGMPNTNSGFAFFWSNHPIYGTSFEPVLSPSLGISYQDLIPEDLRSLNEVELDRALMRAGLDFVRQDPLRYVRLTISRIPVYFLFWPVQESSLASNVARVASFGLFLPFMLIGIGLSLAKCQWKEIRILANSAPSSTQCRHLVLIFAFILLYTVIHLASWANVRYRLPVDAFLIMFAGYAGATLRDYVPWSRQQHKERTRGI